MNLHNLRKTLPGWLLVFLALSAAPATAQEPFGTQNPLADNAELNLNEAERPSIAYGNGKSLVVWRERRSTLR